MMLMLLSAIDMRLGRHFAVGITSLLRLKEEGFIGCDLCICINLVKNLKGVLQHSMHLLYTLLVSTIFYGMIDACLHLVNVLLKLLQLALYDLERVRLFFNVVMHLI